MELITGVLALVAPYLAKGAEAFAVEAGKAALEKAKALLAKVRDHWEGDKQATQTLQRFERDPKANRAEFEETLQTSISKDEQFANDLKDMLNAALAITQVADFVEKQTGIRTKKITISKGPLKIEQRAKRATEQTGIDAEEIEL